jgi:integrase/recombinase XerD
MKSSRTGTGTLAEIKDNPTWDDLMTAWKQWLSVGNYAAYAQKDFPQKVQLLRLFLTNSRLLDDAGRVDLASIDAATMSDYQAFVYDYVSPKTGQRLATSSQIHALSYVQTLFRFLLKTGRIAFDPATIIRLPRHPQTLPAALLTPEEIKKLLTMPDLHTPCGFRDRCILELFWSTGMRVGELLSLSIADLDFAQSLCTIQHGKGDKPRVVPLGTGVIAWLQEYLTNVRPLLTTADGAAVPIGSAPSHLFLSRFGRAMDKSGLFYKLHAYRRRAKIKKRVTPHSFRHTLASEMLKAGADLRHIQELLGHENLTTTQRYLHIVKGDLRKVHGKTHPREVHAPLLSANYHGERS